MLAAVTLYWASEQVVAVPVGWEFVEASLSLSGMAAWRKDVE